LIEQGTQYVPTYVAVDPLTLPAMVTQAQLDVLEMENLNVVYLDPQVATL
jgi:hypothetical protein